MNYRPHRQQAESFKLSSLAWLTWSDNSQAQSSHSQVRLPSWSLLNDPSVQS